MNFRDIIKSLSGACCAAAVMCGYAVEGMVQPDRIGAAQCRLAFGVEKSSFYPRRFSSPRVVVIGQQSSLCFDPRLRPTTTWDVVLSGESACAGFARGTRSRPAVEVGGECCEAEVIELCSAADGMINDKKEIKHACKMPAIAYSQNEGHNTSSYHSHLNNDDFEGTFLMPRTREELHTYYLAWNAHNSNPGHADLSSKVGYAMDNIRLEICLRLIDGNPGPIDDYLTWFGDFVHLLDAFDNEGFAVSLKYKLFDTLSMACCSVTRGGCLKRVPSASVLDFAAKLDSVLNSSIRFQGSGLRAEVERVSAEVEK